VVLYQGLSQDLGPISMSEPVEVTDIALADLPEVTRQQVQSTITASDRSSADQIIDRLEQVSISNQPLPAPAPSDAGGASDSGGASDAGGASDGGGTPTPDEGEGT